MIDPSVSRRHAYVQIIDRSVYVIDLNSRVGLRIAGVPVREGWVNPGQVLTIGDFDIEFSGPFQAVDNPRSPISQQLESPKFRLAIFSGAENSDPIFSLVQNPMTLIGKDAICNLRFIDRRINSFHVAIVKTDGDARIINIPGSGGVRLNDRLIRTSVLQVGDRISLNGLMIEVHSSVDESVPADSSSLKSSSDFHESPPYVDEFSDHLPMAEQVSELRQASMMMAALFAEMKREQSQLIQYQLEWMEMLTMAFRESRSNGHEIAPDTAGKLSPSSVAGVLPNPITPLQVPHMSDPVDPADAAKLAEAHEWFLAKLGKLKSNS